MDYLKKHLAGFAFGVSIALGIVLVSQVIFPVPSQAPNGVKYEYVPSTNHEEFVPKTPTHEDDSSILPNTSGDPETVVPKQEKLTPLPPPQKLKPVTSPELPAQAEPDQGTTTYFGYDHKTKLKDIAPSEIPEIKVIPATQIVKTTLKKKYHVTFTTYDISTGLSHHHSITRTDTEFVTITFESLTDGNHVVAQNTEGL
jgi:hypothetical protein